MSNTSKASAPEAGANISRTPGAYEKWPAWESDVLMVDDTSTLQDQLAVRGRQGWRIVAVMQGTCLGMRPMGCTVFLERPFGMNWREGVQAAESISEPKPKPVDGGIRPQQTNVNGYSSNKGGGRR